MKPSLLLQIGAVGALASAAAGQGLALPAAPSDLRARLGPGTRVEISWMDNSSNEDGFVIQRRTIYEGESDSFRVLARVGPGVTRYVHPAPIKRGETQYFRVRAFNRQGDSSWSNVAVYRR